MDKLRILTSVGVGAWKGVNRECKVEEAMKGEGAGSDNVSLSM